MSEEVLTIAKDLRTQTEGLLGEIVRDAKREELQQSALSIYAKVIELEKELEHLVVTPLPRSVDGGESDEQLIAAEINKVSRKLPKWAANQHQINSKILTRYLELRRQGIAVPGDLCVVGFDDSREAAERDLTSYNVNANGIARSMLQSVLHPREIRGRRAPTPVDIDGYVVPRGSAPPNYCPHKR